MDKQTIFDQINDIKQVSNDYVGRLVEFYGSPENDMATLEVKPFPTYSFKGDIEIKKVKKNEDGSILYEDKDGHLLTYLEIPIEGMLKIAYEISCQNGIGDMFNELFKGEEVE
jgi:hypothetical protein